MLFVIIALLFLAIFLSGMYSRDARRERKRRRVLERGERKTAVVVSADSGRKRGGLTEVSLLLELDDGGQAEARERVNATELCRCEQGAKLRVAVEPPEQGDHPPRAVVTSYRA